MEQTQKEQSLIVLQKRLPMLVTMAVAIVLCCAVVMNFTRAWYSNNLDASAEGMQIISESPDVEFELIIYRQGKIVYDSTDLYEKDANGEYVTDANGEKIPKAEDETPWIGLLPGEEYIFLLEIKRTEGASEEPLDLQIGFLGIEGYPLGTTYNIITGTSDSNGIVATPALQTMEIPGQTLTIESGSASVSGTGEDAIITILPASGEKEVILTTNATLGTDAEGTKSFSAPEIIIKNASLNDAGTVVTFQAGDKSLLQAGTGHLSTEVFQIGCFANSTIDENTGKITSVTYHDQPISRTTQSMEEIFQTVKTANLATTETPNPDLKISYMPANEFVSPTENYYIYHHEWQYSGDETSIVVPFGIKILNAEDYMGDDNGNIIIASSDLSNISFRVEGIFINAVPLDTSESDSDTTADPAA